MPKLRIAVSVFQKFSSPVKDTEVKPTEEFFSVLVCLVDRREGYRGEAVSYPVIYDYGAGNWFHNLCLPVLKAKPDHIRNHLKSKGFLTMIEPLIIDVVIGTTHKCSEGVKNPLPHKAIVHTQKSIEVESGLETLKGVLECGVAVDVLKSVSISWKSLGIKIIQLGLTIVLSPDVVNSAHNEMSFIGYTFIVYAISVPKCDYAL